MNIVYLGTPDFSVKPLKRLLELKDHKVVGVVTNCDKPVGRKKVLTSPPVKIVALENNIPVYQYEKIRLEGVEDLKKLKPDLMITCAFGQILSQEIIDIAKYGVINIHASLLPKYRGASPIHQAILDGEKTTGITIMKTDIGIDTGDIILQKEVEIGETETCGELFEKLSIVGADLIVEAISQLEKGEIKLEKQCEANASLTKMIKKEDAYVDFTMTAKEIVAKVRAFNPSPIAYTIVGGQPFKIYKAIISDLSGETARIIKADNELVVACKDGAVSLLEVQKAGGKPMAIADFLRGNKFNVGDKFN